MRNHLFLLIIIGLSISCKQEKIDVTDGGTLKVYLPADPEKLNPLFNPKASAREIYQNIFAAMADYHPETLELFPVVLTKVPEGKSIENGLIRYNMEIKADAVWADGKTITAEDYLFTIKSILHPEVNTAGWRSFVQFIKSVDLDPEDNKKFSVDVSDETMLSREIVSTIYILPKHVYDKDDLLGEYSLTALSNESSLEELRKDSSYVRFAKAFNNPKNYRDNLVHAGPYELENWVTDQFILLKKKPNYWGDNYPDNPFLQGFAEEIQFKIFSDELTAFTNFKDDGMDVMKFKTSDYFLQLLENDEETDEFNFETPQLMRYFYLCINNRKDGLSDKTVRQAMAHSMDVEGLINLLEGNYGMRVAGPIHPTKSYYNQDIKAPSKDLGLARKLLDDAGYMDTNGDGVREKGDLELSFDILTSTSMRAKQVTDVFKEGCEKVGIKINIVQKSPRLFISEDVYTHKYDMAALSQTLDASPDDPKYRWHSSNAGKGGSNLSGYQNETCDKIIDQISSTLDPEKRAALYKHFQRIINEDQPVIFLYSPTEKIAIDKEWQGKGTSKRPGYLLNTFKQAS